MVKIYLDGWMSGKGDVRMSDWFLPHLLLDEQLEYAGNDAFAAGILFESMISKFDACWKEEIAPFGSTLSKVRKGKGEASVQNPPAASPEEKKERARLARFRKVTAQY